MQHWNHITHDHYSTIKHGFSYSTKSLPVRDFTTRGPLWSSFIFTSYQPWKKNNESCLNQTILGPLSKPLCYGAFFKGWHQWQPTLINKIIRFKALLLCSRSSSISLFISSLMGLISNMFSILLRVKLLVSFSSSSLIISLKLWFSSTPHSWVDCLSFSISWILSSIWVWMVSLFFFINHCF